MKLVIGEPAESLRMPTLLVVRESTARR